MIPAFISLMVGSGMALLVWYGWALAEDIQGMLRARSERAAKAVEPSPAGGKK